MQHTLSIGVRDIFPSEIFQYAASNEVWRNVLWGRATEISDTMQMNGGNTTGPNGL